MQNVTRLVVSALIYACAVAGAYGQNPGLAPGGSVYGNPTASQGQPKYTQTPVLGIPGSVLGTLGLAGNSSGTGTLRPPAAASNYTWTLPAASGTLLLSPGGGLTEGSVVFAGTAGILSQNNSNFFWKDSTGQLALGTNVPFVGTAPYLGNARLTISGYGYQTNNAAMAGLFPAFDNETPGNLTLTGDYKFSTIASATQPAGHTLAVQMQVNSTAAAITSAGAAVFGFINNSNNAGCDCYATLNILKHPFGATHPQGAASWALLRGEQAGLGITGFRATNEISHNTDLSIAGSAVEINNSTQYNPWDNGIAIGGAQTYGVVIGSGGGSPVNWEPLWPFAYRRNATAVKAFYVDNSGKLSLNQNTATEPALGGVASAALRATGANNDNTRLLLDAFNAVPSITGRRSAGTLASPSATQNTEIMLSVASFGYGATQYSVSPTTAINFVADGNFTDTSNPTRMEFYVTTPASVTPTVAWTIFSDKTLLGGGPFQVNQNAVAAPALGGIGSAVIRAVGNNNDNTRALLDAFNAVPSFTGRRSAGTNAVKTATQTGEAMLSFSSFGYGATGYSTSPTTAINFTAAGNFTDTSMPTQMEFYTTPSGSNSPVKGMQINSNRTVQMLGYGAGVAHFDASGNITSSAVALGGADVGGILTAAKGGNGIDASACSGALLFTAGSAVCTGTSGTGNFARVTSPTFVTPTLGVASATSLDVTGSSINTNGLYLPSANTVGIAANGVQVGTFASTNKGVVTFGNTTSTATATPFVMDFGGTFSSVAGANPKWMLYNDGATKYGLGLSSSSFDVILGTSGAMNWYVPGPTKIATLSTGGRFDALLGFSSGGTVGVSCTVGTLNTATAIVINGIVTHC